MPFENQYFLLLIYLWSLLKNFSASCLLLITRHVNKTGLIIPREFYMNARIYASMRCKHPFYGKPSPPLTLSVLYLSRPCLTFSAWIWSITVVAFVSFRSPSWFLSSWKRNVLQSCIKIFKVFRGLIWFKHTTVHHRQKLRFAFQVLLVRSTLFLSIKKICIQQSFFTISHSVVCAVHSHATTWPTWSISRRFLRSVMGAVGPVRSLADK